MAIVSLPSVTGLSLVMWSEGLDVTQGSHLCRFKGSRDFGSKLRKLVLHFFPGLVIPRLGSEAQRLCGGLRGKKPSVHNLLQTGILIVQLCTALLV